MGRLGTVLMWSVALVAGGWLAGCAGQRAGDVGPKTEDRAVKTTPAKVQIPSPDHFTTKGKPTKTIQTPNGPVEIYDPTQDPEVRAAFDMLYNKRAKFFSHHPKVVFHQSDLHTWEWQPFFKKNGRARKLGRILSMAERAQTYDYMRAGCQMQSDYQCYGPTNDFDVLIKKCPKYRWGNFRLSSCEDRARKGLSHNYEAGVMPEVTCRVDGRTEKGFYIQHIGYPYYGNKDQQFSRFFYKSCEKW